MHRKSKSLCHRRHMRCLRHENICGLALSCPLPPPPAVATYSSRIHLLRTCKHTRLQTHTDRETYVKCREVYEKSGRPLVNELMDGYNCTIFACKCFLPCCRSSVLLFLFVRSPVSSPTCIFLMYRRSDRQWQDAHNDGGNEEPQGSLHLPACSAFIFAIPVYTRTYQQTLCVFMHT